MLELSNLDLELTSNQRQHERETQDSGMIIEIRKQIDQEQLGESIEAILVDYSLGGCGLIVTNQESPKLEDIYHFDIAKLDPELKSIIAEVRWYQQLKNNSFRIGFKFIDIIQAEQICPFFSDVEHKANIIKLMV